MNYGYEQGRKGYSGKVCQADKGSIVLVGFLFVFCLFVFFSQLDISSSHLGEETTIKKLLPSKWAIGKSAGHFLK